MTNLEYIRKHSYTEIMADALDKALDAWDDDSLEELYALKWLFSERRENVQLPKDNELNL